MQFALVSIREANEFERALSGLAERGGRALSLVPDGMFLAQGNLMIDLAARNRLATMFGITDLLAQAGGLMASGVNFASMFRLGASFVDKILRGAKPTDPPVERPEQVSTWSST